MNPLNQINIEEKKTIYDVTCTYHSGMKCQNYDAAITGIEEADGNVTLRPWANDAYDGSFFEFDHSDPDRVIAIAQMMLSFAQMVKKNNQKSVDTNANA